MDEKEKRIIDSLSPFIVPIYFVHNGSRSSSSNNIFSNATLTLLDTGERKLFVTCYHVWSEYQKTKTNEPELLLCLGRGNAKPLVKFTDIKLIDGDEKDLDIVVLSYQHEKIFEEGEKHFFKADSWPPSKVSPREVVGFLGYPGSLRRSYGADSRGIFSGLSLFVDYVTSVSDRNIILADEANDRERKEYVKGFEQSGTFGGISGSPVFKLKDNKYEFIGLVRSGGQGTHATIFITPADYINRNGTINRSRMPWCK